MRGKLITRGSGGERWTGLLLARQLLRGRDKWRLWEVSFLDLFFSHIWWIMKWCVACGISHSYLTGVSAAKLQTPVKYECDPTDLIDTYEGKRWMPNWKINEWTDDNCHHWSAGGLPYPVLLHGKSIISTHSFLCHHKGHIYYHNSVGYM